MTEMTAAQSRNLHVGIDIGSTTVKAVVLDADTNEELFGVYRRHGSQQIQATLRVLDEIVARFPFAHIRCALCGSGSEDIARGIGAPFIQEVVAGATAVRALYPQANCTIELGGQDAKMIFFRHDESGVQELGDMRMNGSCAGGTGAFIDEVAEVLSIPVEQFNEYAEAGTRTYDISGRCGVYAKTDIQPLLNNGVSKCDLALSTFHAIAKQTLGGLAQGLDVRAPIVFMGGPLTFNPRLIGVFKERLGLSDDQALIPDHPETMVARGAALSLSDLFAAEDASLCIEHARVALSELESSFEAQPTDAPLFANAEEKADFEARHGKLAECGGVARARELCDSNRSLRVWLGIDSGSTTTKLALVADDGEVIDSFYASNEGEPLAIARDALIALRDRYASAGIQLDIAGVGVTGYGEDLFASAFSADCHTVETVAHVRAARAFVPDASFILDIGGQDMKAMWVEDGIVRDIVVNEACSSGCGSFLENFAQSLGIQTSDIAQAAFRSEHPAHLGSRCTVFMNSSIVSEQKNGRTPDDIMAGLCRSIIENVFTKVIRVSNLDSLGDRIVVQGGTFANDAVLRALEAYVGRNVVRAPYPGLMGAIGCALIASDRNAGEKSSFIGLDALDGFAFTTQANVPCDKCANRCARTVVSFSDGRAFVTGNRCARGEISASALESHAAGAACKRVATPVNLFATRQRLLFKEWPSRPLCPKRHITVGLPRVLALWDTAPFWTTFLRALGFDVELSSLSTRSMYEDGLPSVTSDTVCFPAKIVHGHVRQLARMGVDRIFMPIITTVPTENRAETSVSMCAVVKGYPMVVKSSDDPARTWNVPFDTPLFHWFSTADRDRQLCAYVRETFGIDEGMAREAIRMADGAQESFKRELVERGSAALDAAREAGAYAVVLASRPYHNDPLVNHRLPELFCKLGISVLPPDAVPHIEDVDLSASLIDVVNNFHARMLASAVLAAESPNLEYVQLVSFGCGHDAYLSDEIARLMRERSGGAKTPLILKTDESDASGPLRIRVRSFIETVDARRERASAPATPHELPDPYPQKFTRADRREKVILVPNTSHAFCRLMSSVFCKQGVRAVPLDLGRERAIELGKRYVHNDICFPAQIVIGEALAALESGRYDDADVAIGTGKYIGDCRLTHYAALLRKALDDAGYAHVPIITNDDADAHNIHPGFRMNLASAIRIAMGLPMIDALEALLRRIRPYELEPGAADAAFEAGIDAIMEGIERHGVAGAKRGFKRAISLMNNVKYDRSNPRPTVLIVGEYLLNFHPGANRDIEAYLERNGFEIIEARMTDVIRKTYFYQDAQSREFHVTRPAANVAFNRIANTLFEHAHDVCDRIGKAHPLYEPPCRMGDLVQASDPIIHHTFDAGEGVLIAAEILHHAQHGCSSFVILQPFGCLPNHVVGRGIVKQLKERYPHANILPLDYDPDVSFANIENRLQMLVMSAHASKGASSAINDNRAKGECRG